MPYIDTRTLDREMKKGSAELVILALVEARPRQGDAGALAESIRDAISRIDTEQLVSVRNVATLEQIAAQASSRHRFRAVLVLFFASLALILAMSGVFGALACTEQQRLRDLGLRRALGASQGTVLVLVLGHATRLLGTGAAIGLLLALTLSQLLDKVLFGVEGHDASTYALALILLLLLCATAALAAPLWRATQVDPALVLRGE
jgi:ABC-type antimicrobial peptide transport system permease subunit